MGIEDSNLQGTAGSHASDSGFACDAACLSCDVTYYSHIGHYRCPSCSLKRPTPALRGENELLVSREPCRGRRSTGNISYTVKVPGIYNCNTSRQRSRGVYGDRLATIGSGIEEFSAAFGRVERLDLQGRHLFLAREKPRGFNESLPRSP